MNNPQLEPESEKEFYDQLGEELMPLLNQLNVSSLKQVLDWVYEDDDNE